VLHQRVVLLRPTTDVCARPSLPTPLLAAANERHCFAAGEDEDPDIQGPLVFSHANFFPLPLYVADWRAPSVTVCPRVHACACPYVTDQWARPCRGPPIRRQCPGVPVASPLVSRATGPRALPARARPRSCPVSRMPGPLTRGTRRLALKVA
jgi:hypothetical protein